MGKVRTILALAAHFSWDIQQYDVKNSFLHGDLEEEIYMKVPLGFKGKVLENIVCKLKKALCGLKQSPRAWFGGVTKAMTSKEYQQSQADPTLLIKHSTTRKISIWLVYVDDILITGDDEEGKQSLGRHHDRI